MKYFLSMMLFLTSSTMFANVNTLFESDLDVQNYGNINISSISSIYDGDTFRVNIDSFPGIIGERIPIRINGIDTPEMKGNCRKEIELAREAKKFTVNFLRSAKIIELRNIKRDKYFRIDADVYGDGINLGELLIKNNLAISYFGEKKTKNWCE